MKPIDLAGLRFGRLLVESRAGSVDGEATWACLCDCGGATVARGYLLRSGKTRSCGCLARESSAQIALARTQHGHARSVHTSPTYRTWVQMRTRCRDARNPTYGGRGITVCARWERFTSFLADMGERPHGMTIDRIDNDRGYEPGNCRWATAAEQNRNRSDTRRITIGDRTRSAAEWAREHGVLPNTAYERIRRGWNERDAVTVPARTGGNSHA